MAEIGKYIYGIINSKDKRYFKCCELAKLDIEVVYSIPYEDISAVISDSEIIDYTRMQKEALARQLIKHQKIAEDLMSQGYTIIPMRLGTFGENADEVRRILARSYSVSKEIFERIKDKIEIDVAATWNDFNSLIKEIGDESSIVEFKNKFGEHSQKITIDDQMKLGFMVKNSLNRRSKECANRIDEALKPISHSFKAHELMDDKMVTNTAYLIEKVTQKEFEETIERLNAEFGGKLDFRCVGPFPPYSFYTLEVKRLSFNDINWAKERLGITDTFTSEEDIKKAYHRQAVSSHPDKASKRLNPEDEFNEVNKAYNMLLEYCEAWRQSGEANPSSFEKNAFKGDAILIKKRG